MLQRREECFMCLLSEMVNVNLAEGKKGTIHFDGDFYWLFLCTVTQKDVSPFNIEANRWLDDMAHPMKKREEDKGKRAKRSKRQLRNDRLKTRATRLHTYLQIYREY
jgi:hypothetical protein